MAGLFFSPGRVISDASMIAAFYHEERAARWTVAGSILEQAPGISWIDWCMWRKWLTS